MGIYIDADGCPVVNQAIRLGNRAGLEVVLLCDTSHVFQREGARTITVSRGRTAWTSALVNLLKPGDVAVTQDYGLAAMCLARGPRPSARMGWFTTTAISTPCCWPGTQPRKSGMPAGGSGKPKRAPWQDAAFEEAFPG